MARLLIYDLDLWQNATTGVIDVQRTDGRAEYKRRTSNYSSVLVTTLLGVEVYYALNETWLTCHAANAYVQLQRDLERLTLMSKHGIPPPTQVLHPGRCRQWRLGRPQISLVVQKLKRWLRASA